MSLWLDSLSFGLNKYSKNSEERAKCIFAHLSMITPRSWWKAVLQTGHINDSHINIIRDLYKELLKIPGLADQVDFGLLVAMAFMDDDNEKGKLKYGDVDSEYSIEQYIDKARNVLNERPELDLLIKTISRRMTYNMTISKLSEKLRSSIDGQIQTETNRQLEEIMSWRFITEFWRRFPKLFYLIEAHPCNGEYDCLVLMTRGKNPQFAIDVNRGGGSIHIHENAFELGDDINLHSDWLTRMLQPTPAVFLDEIAQEVRLAPPKKLPTSTPETIVYRFISDFLTHSVGRLEKWECRNGYLDIFECGGGKRNKLFEKFPGLRKEENLRKVEPFLGEYEYNFWFLLKDDVPFLCLDTSGIVYRRDGRSYDLGKLYQSNRKIWPLIFTVAQDILP